MPSSDLPTYSVHVHRRRHNDHTPALLQLPDNGLEIIARKTGKEVRYICSKLRHAYGSPGSVLVLPDLGSTCSSDPLNWTPYDFAIRSWPYPHALRRLELGHHVFFNGHGSVTIADALPNLREMSCAHLGHLTAYNSRVAPLTALTSVCCDYVSSDQLGSLPVLAPRLQLLCVREQHIRRRQDGWGPLASLHSLQHLDMKLHSGDLNPQAFPAVLWALTSLTAVCIKVDECEVPSEDALSFTRALAALPLLSSVQTASAGWGSPWGRRCKQPG